MSLYSFARPLAFALDAERAHRLTIAALRIMPALDPARFPESLHSTVAGLDFPSPVGLAAGFDKNGEVPEQMHPPLIQGGVILPWARSREGAMRFRDFLVSADGRRILAAYGFGAPPR